MDGFIVRAIDHEIESDAVVPLDFDRIEAAKDVEKRDAGFNDVVVGFPSHRHFEVRRLIVVNAFRCPLSNVGLVAVEAPTFWAEPQDVSPPNRLSHRPPVGGVALCLQVGRFLAFGRL